MYDLETRRLVDLCTKVPYLFFPTSRKPHANQKNLSSVADADRNAVQFLFDATRFFMLVVAPSVAKFFRAVRMLSTIEEFPLSSSPNTSVKNVSIGASSAGGDTCKTMAPMRYKLPMFLRLLPLALNGHRDHS